jgi:hypothetical protein
VTSHRGEYLSLSHTKRRRGRGFDRTWPQRWWTRNHAENGTTAFKSASGFTSGVGLLVCDSRRGTQRPTSHPDLFTVSRAAHIDWLGLAMSCRGARNG